MGPYVVQLLPDMTGALLLRKLLLFAIDQAEPLELTDEQVDVAHEMYATISKNIRRKTV